MTSTRFPAFFDEDFDRLVGFLCKAGYGREIARDAAAETMTCLLEKWTEVTNPKAWVRTVASRIAYRIVLEGPRSIDAAIRGAWSITDKADDHVQHAVVEEQPLIVSLLRRLPDMQRLVMAWHLDGFTTTEIAEQIGSTPMTVRSNLRHARARLKTIYDQQEADQAGHWTNSGRRRR